MLNQCLRIVELHRQCLCRFIGEQRLHVLKINAEASEVLTYAIMQLGRECPAFRLLHLHQLGAQSAQLFVLFVRRFE